MLDSFPNPPQEQVPMARLDQLPLEVVGFITAYMIPKDIHSMSLTCHRLYWALMHNDHIARITLQKYVPSSLEAQDASSDKVPGSYARGLRRLVKRSLAMATATPFSVALITMADAYVYCGGMLCYTTHEPGTRTPNLLRLLNLHQSSSTETVVYLQSFLRNCLKTRPPEYVFEPVHYSHGLVSCVYKPLGERNIVDRTLFVLRPSKNELVMSLPLRRPLDYDYFVRNNHDQIWLGEWESVADGQGHLILRCFSIPCGEWTTWFVRTPECVGDDLGKTSCVEIINDYMYIVSNSTTSSASQARDADWVSHYYALRFPLTAPDQLEVAPKENLWRRQHQEGPIHDTTISIEHDAASSKLTIVEVRRETPGAVWPPVTTCYRTDLDFSRVGPGTNTSLTSIESIQRLRSPSHVHRFDETVQDSPFKPYYVRSYQQDSEGFLDVFPDNNAVVSGEAGDHPWLRVRSASKIDPNNKLSCWPTGPIAGPDIANLYQILSPQIFPGRFQLQGTIDERSIIYAVGERRTDMLRPVIFMSFDPSFKLLAPRWLGGEPRSFPDAPSGPSSMDQTSDDSHSGPVSDTNKGNFNSTFDDLMSYQWVSNEELEEVCGFNFAL